MRTARSLTALPVSLLLLLGGCALDAPSEVEASAQGLTLDAVQLCDVSILGEDRRDGPPLRWRPDVRLEVTPSCDGPDEFELELVLESGVPDTVRPGNEVELSMGFEREGACSIFEGEVSTIEPDFRADSVTFTFRGWDHLHRLTRGFRSRCGGDGPEGSTPEDDVPAISIFEPELVR